MRLKLTLSFILVVLVSVLGVVLAAQFGAAREVRLFMSRGGMIRLESLADQLEEYYRQNQSWNGVEVLLEAFLASPGGGMGNRPEHAGQGMMARMMGGDLLLADAEGKVVADTSGTRLSERLSEAEFDLALPLKSGWKTVGYLLLVGGMSFSTGDERFLIERLTQAAVTGGLIAAGIAIGLAFVIAYRIARPVQLLTGAAQRLSLGDLSQRVKIAGNDEVAELGRAFNQMAESLQRAQESRRAMTADIAHELRTPLAVQRANLEALQDGVYELTPANLEPILEQNRLLTRLVEDLRLLALADAGQLKMELTPTDLTSLLEQMVERFRAQVEAQQVSIQLQSPSKRPILMLDPMRFEQVLGNLLSNALRYTPPGGEIQIRLTTSPFQVTMTMRDTGPGIPEEALPFIFERFYRADRARSRQEGGSGLGLAIARQIVEAHGGQLTAANHPQGGAVFTVCLPVSPQPVEAQ